MSNKDIVIAEINRLCASQERVIIALDGRCGSGKTTLADKISREIPCAVLHMDDFFLRPEQRTATRYSTPGENVDHERFSKEVLRPLYDGQEYVYQPFVCHSMSFGEKTVCTAQKVTIVEGTYACHPSLWDYYDLRVFVTVSPQTQLERIRARCGEEGLAAFKSRWIPLEEEYFSAFSLESRCDIRLLNE